MSVFTGSVQKLRAFLFYEKKWFTEILHDLYGFLTETCFNGIVGKQKEEVM